MEEKTQEVREEASNVVVLDAGIAPTDLDVEFVCCLTTLIPFRSY